MCTIKILLDVLKNIKICSTLSIFPYYAERSLGHGIKPAKIITVNPLILFSDKLPGITC